MFRFTIRDLLWLMVVVGVCSVWAAERWRQGARLRILEDIAGLDAIELFPRSVEGRMQAFSNQNALLRLHVESLTRELQSRGHRVEIDGCNVFVDRPFSLQLALPLAE